MKIGIMQPYLFPYLGYFQLIDAVDKFVIYDDVNFIKSGWINRNRILMGGKPHIFSLGIINKSSFKKINELKIVSDIENRNRILANINSSYKKSPMYTRVFPLIKQSVLYDENNLAKYVSNSIILLCKYLKITTEILISSNIAKDTQLRGQEKVINICKVLNGDIYINAIGGQKLYSKINFKKNSIKLQFIEMLPTTYKQYSEMFIPNLSIIDVLMFNSTDEISNMLSRYELR